MKKENKYLKATLKSHETKLQQADVSLEEKKRTITHLEEDIKNIQSTLQRTQKVYSQDAEAQKEMVKWIEVLSLILLKLFNDQIF